MSFSIRGHGSEKCEYLVDRFKAEVESWYVLIGAFKICNVFRRKARSIPFEVRPLSFFSKNLSMKPFGFWMYTSSSSNEWGTNYQMSCSSGQVTNWPVQSVLHLQFVHSLSMEEFFWVVCRVYFHLALWNISCLYVSSRVLTTPFAGHYQEIYIHLRQKFNQ